MPKRHPSEKPALTLERLLQIKRAERPGQEFWDSFDRELQRRQLATVVKERPWYLRLPQTAVTLLRRTAPYGAAAAALAAGFVVFDHRGKESEDTSAHQRPQLAQTDSQAPLVVLPVEAFDTEVAPVEADRGPNASEPTHYSQPQYVVHQFELPPAPVRPWKTVASSDMLTVSSAGKNDGFESTNGWSAGPALRAPANPGAGSF